MRYAHLANDAKGEWAITGHLASACSNARMWEESEKTYEEFFSMPVYDSLYYLIAAD